MVTNQVGRLRSTAPATKRAKGKTKIIMVMSQKGGQGKTALSFHLSHAAASKPGVRVLGLDHDTQGNFSQFLTDDLGIKKVTHGGADLLFEGRPLVPRKTTHAQIDLLHGHQELDKFDQDEEATERAYSDETPELLRSLGYDYVIIDTPPAVGLRQLAPLRWADVILVPMEPTLSGIDSFQSVLGILDEYITDQNSNVKWCGVLNRVNMSSKTQRGKVEWLHEEYGPRIMETLRTRTAVADAMEESPAKPVWLRSGVSKDLANQWRGFCEKVLSL